MAGLSLLVLHDDENTAVEAGAAFVAVHGGRASLFCDTHYAARNTGGP